MSKLAIDGGTPVRDQYLVFGRPAIDDAEIDEVVDTLRSRWIGTGPKTHRFEQDFARYVGAGFAVAVNSCTAGLHMALIIHEVGPGDQVIAPSMTFCATINTIIHVGATPVFVDVDPDTLCISPELVAAAVTERTKVVLPVHFGGLAADLDGIAAAAPDAAIVEDAAHAIGTRYKGTTIGGRGHLTSFSFYANKNLTTAEGGMLTLAHEEHADRLRVMRLHGMHNDAWRRYRTHALVHTEVVDAGWKYNMTDLQASLGIHQLKKQERFLVRREEIARRYDAAIDPMPEIRRQFRPRDLDQNRHALHLYSLLLDLERLRVERDQVVSALRAENIGAGIHYRPVHREPYYAAAMAGTRRDLPVTEKVGESVLTLPLTPEFSERDVDDVIEAVEKVIGAYRR